jgi:hypothetical protein
MRSRPSLVKNGVSPEADRWWARGADGLIGSILLLETIGSA